MVDKNVSDTDWGQFVCKGQTQDHGYHAVNVRGALGSDSDKTQGCQDSQQSLTKGQQGNEPRRCNYSCDTNMHVTLSVNC